jgi:TetR/AcrR family transcriptional regulator
MVPGSGDRGRLEDNEHLDAAPPIDSRRRNDYINNHSVINFMPIKTLDSDAQSRVHAKHERRKDARPGELLAAALELFVEKGFAATRVEEVAKLAGVSKGTLFIYFASKEELFKAVVRENISGRFQEWNTEFENFQGNSADMLRYCLNGWWERIGSTKASGITKLMMSEARNFPELAAFYEREVIQPGHALIGRVLQRGVDRGEFRAIDMKYGVYIVFAPMLFLAMWKHSLGTCCDAGAQLVPEDYIALQVETILNGLSIRQPTPPLS